MADRKSEFGGMGGSAVERAAAGRAHPAPRPTPAHLPATHFLALDALRGVAAVAVLCLHWCEGLGSAWFGGARLAVDFFFLLSGFVIDHAYRQRLAQGLGFGRFMILRVIRLWPMIAAGAVFGLLRETMRGIMIHDPDFSLSRTLFHFGLNLFLFPDLWSGPDAYKFPLNIAMWSLLAEFVAYALYALFSHRAGKIAVAAILAVSGAAVAAWLVGYFGDKPIGPHIPGLGWPFDFARAVFAFSLGTVLYRVHDRFKGPRLGPWACAALLLLVLTVPAAVLVLPVRALVLAGLFPLLVLAGAHVQPAGTTARLAGLLGDLSYPLYAVHTPLIWLLGGALGRVVHVNIPQIALGVVVLPATAVIAYFLLRFYDEPLRRYLGRLYRGSQSLKTAS